MYFYMGRQEIDKRHIRKLHKSEDSYMVTLPMEAIRKLGWKKRQKLVVDFDEDDQTITITDWEA